MEGILLLYVFQQHRLSAVSTVRALRGRCRLSANRRRLLSASHVSLTCRRSARGRMFPTACRGLGFAAVFALGLGRRTKVWKERMGRRERAGLSHELRDAATYSMAHRVSHGGACGEGHTEQADRKQKGVYPTTPRFFTIMLQTSIHCCLAQGSHEWRPSKGTTSSLAPPSAPVSRTGVCAYTHPVV